MFKWIGDTSQTQILVNIIIWEWNKFDHVYCNNKIIYDYIEHTLNTLYLWPDSDQTGCRGSQKTAGSCNHISRVWETSKRHGTGKFSHTLLTLVEIPGGPVTIHKHHGQSQCLSHGHPNLWQIGKFTSICFS